MDRACDEATHCQTKRLLRRYAARNDGYRLTLINSLVLLPILIPLLGALIAIVLRRNHRVQSAWAFGTLLASSWSASVAAVAHGVADRRQPLVLQLGAWPAPFGISLVADLLAAVFVVMAQTVLRLGALYALGSREQARAVSSVLSVVLDTRHRVDWRILTGDIFNLFVFAELLVISGTVLTAISDDKHGVEAAYKYFFISLLASISLLIAIGCLYASYGTLNLADLAQRISGQPRSALCADGGGLPAGGVHGQEARSFRFISGSPIFTAPRPRPSRHAVVGGGEVGHLWPAAPDDVVVRAVCADDPSGPAGGRHLSA